MLHQRFESGDLLNIASFKVCLFNFFPLAVSLPLLLSLVAVVFRAAWIYLDFLIINIPCRICTCLETISINIGLELKTLMISTELILKPDNNLSISSRAFSFSSHIS